jgi:amino-acid N-acetyltransferase
MKIRKATLKDVKEINKIINYYSRKRLMLYRPCAQIERNIRDYFVYKLGNEVIGNCALRIWSKKSAEIYALAVKPKYTSKGIGSALVKECIKEVKKLKVESIFTFTLKASFFEKFGFKKINFRELPKVVFTEKTEDVEKAYGMKL